MILNMTPVRLVDASYEIAMRTFVEIFGFRVAALRRRSRNPRLGHQRGDGHQQIAFILTTARLRTANETMHLKN